MCTLAEGCVRTCHRRWMACRASRPRCTHSSLKRYAKLHTIADALKWEGHRQSRAFLLFVSRLIILVRGGCHEFSSLKLFCFKPFFPLMNFSYWHLLLLTWSPTSQRSVCVNSKSDLGGTTELSSSLYCWGQRKGTLPLLCTIRAFPDVSDCGCCVLFVQGARAT